MVKKRKSNNRLEKDCQDRCERVFSQKKVEVQAVKDSLARKHVLDSVAAWNYARIQLFGPLQIYNYADHAVEAPIVDRNS
jgi:hypothetical protein